MVKFILPENLSHTCDNVKDKFRFVPEVDFTLQPNYVFSQK